MKVALAVWQGRVSPVFDVAGQVLVVELDGDSVVDSREEALPETDLEPRARRLLDLGVGALVCGAISRPLEMLLADRGIQVIARVCGNAEEVLEAYRAGTLGQDRFAMPGCCGRGGRRFRGRCRRGGGGDGKGRGGNRRHWE